MMISAMFNVKINKKFPELSEHPTYIAALRLELRRNFSENVPSAVVDCTG